MKLIGYGKQCQKVSYIIFAKFQGCGTEGTTNLENEQS